MVVNKSWSWSAPDVQSAFDAEMATTTAKATSNPGTPRAAWVSDVGGRTIDDEENFLRVQLFSMALIGVQERETVPSRIYSYFCFYSLLIMDLSMVLFAVQHFGDMVLVCDCLGPGFTAYLGMVKQHYLSEQRKQLWEIIYALKKLKQIAKPDEIRSIERNNQIDRYLATAYLTSAVITGSHFIVTAIVKAVYSKVVHGKFVWQLPLLQSYPFDISHPLMFAVLFVWTSATIYMVVFGSVSSDAAFGGLASNLVVHFKFIQAGFRDRSFEDNDPSLKDLIEYHRHVLDLSRKLISAYRPIMLNNFIVASFLLCVLGFQLVLFMGSTMMFLYIVFVTAIVIQITFFSYYGSQLSHEVCREVEGVSKQTNVCTLTF
ncbi:hypothetical protein quinque_002696 [Culex quinquefasciatus]